MDFIFCVIFEGAKSQNNTEASNHLSKLKIDIQEG